MARRGVMQQGECLRVLEGSFHRRAFKDHAIEERLGDEGAEVEDGVRRWRVWDPPRNGDEHTLAELLCPQFHDVPAPVQAEEVVARRNANTSARRQRHFENTIGAAFNPTSHLGEARLEGVRVEGNYRSFELLLDDLFDRAQLQPSIVKEKNRLFARETRVNQQSESAEAALALEPRHQVVWQRHPLERRAENELPRVQDEHVFGINLDKLSELVLVLFHVNETHGVVAEHSEISI